MSADQEPGDDSLKDLEKEPIDPAEAGNVKGGVLANPPEIKLLDPPNIRTATPIISSDITLGR
jgi:hypothetical protein